MTFDLGGGESLQQVEMERAVLLCITLFLTIVAGGTARGYVKKGDKPTAWGIGSASLLVLIFASVYYLSILSFAVPFDKKVWVQGGSKPFNMSAALMKSKKLIGMTRGQVDNLLGEANKEGEWYKDYDVEDDWTLTVGFKDGKVVNVSMRLPWLGI